MAEPQNAESTCASSVACTRKSKIEFWGPEPCAWEWALWWVPCQHLRWKYVGPKLPIQWVFWVAALRSRTGFQSSRRMFKQTVYVHLTLARLARHNQKEYMHSKGGKRGVAAQTSLTWSFQDNGELVGPFKHSLQPVPITFSFADKDTLAKVCFRSHLRCWHHEDGNVWAADAVYTPSGEEALRLRPELQPL